MNWQNAPLVLIYSMPWQKNSNQVAISKGLCAWCRKPRGNEPGGSKWYCPNCRIRVRIRTKDAHKRNRMQVVAHYGSKCACCKETNPKFLSIDHINNDGAAHYRQDPSSMALAEWLLKHNFPDGFRLLCYNCNCGRHYNGGICPHEELDQKV